MKKILIAIFTLTMTGCAYRSVIIAPRNEGDVIIIYNNLLDSLDFPGRTKSILDKTISSKKLLDSKSDWAGYVHIFLSNSSFFIEAKQFYQNPDLTYLRGTVFDKAKNDTLSFSIQYSPREMDYSITKQRRENFIMNLLPMERLKSDPPKQEFVFSKTKNFIVQDDVFELYTGEVSYKRLKLSNM